MCEIKKYQISTCQIHVPRWYMCPAQNKGWIVTTADKGVGFFESWDKISLIFKILFILYLYLS